MNITLYSAFQKKDNSTKQPGAGVSGAVVPGHLKEPTSVLHPAVRFQNNVLGNGINPDCTYAYIPDFHRYYFINDWTWDNGTWVAQMDVDVLASHKTAIGNKSEYILRTDSTGANYNGAITDTIYPATTNVVTESYSVSNVFTTDLTVGCYIVGIISGGSSTAVGAISYYAMTSAEFGNLKEKLFSDDNLQIMGIINSQGDQLVTDLSQEILKTMYNPYQYIASCMWFPFGKDAIVSKTHVTALKIGWWGYPLSGDLLYAQTLELGNEQFAITAHPQASRGSYLNYAPYTRRTLIGRFGTVALDTEQFKVGTNINISYMIDLITGQCYAKISRRNESVTPPAEDLFAERTFLLGVPIQIAQVGTDYLGTAFSAINGVTGAIGSALNKDLGGVFSNLNNGIYNTLQSAMPQVETGGQNGSFLAPANNTHVVEMFYRIVDEDVTHRGRPLCAVRTINTLSGYVLCAEGDLDLDCYNEERDNIRQYLTTGFYWE